VLFKYGYTVVIKRLLMGVCFLQSIIPMAIHAAPQIKIINGTKKTVAFSLVRTKRGSAYKHLYVMDAKEPKPNEKNLWELFKENLTHAFGKLKETINVRFLVPGLKDGIVMENFPQAIAKYDRVLWLVPIEKLDKLVVSLNSGIKDNAVTALEVGSALTAEITDKNNAGKFKLNTTGKLTEGAKALFNALSGDDSEPIEQEGESLANLTENKIKELKRKYEVTKEKMSSVERKKKIEAIKTKYNR
jgi:hypothetical protein